MTNQRESVEGIAEPSSSAERSPAASGRARRDERWLAVIGYEGLYEVSDMGRVRRVGRARGATPGRVLRPALQNSGYLFVTLYDAPRRRQTLLHHLVAAAFIGPCPDGYEVNHCDLDKFNNSELNLEYVTRSANLLHRSAAGVGRGEKNGTAKLNEQSVIDIRSRYRKGGGPGYKALAREFEVSWESVRDIIERRTWRHVA